MAATKTANSKKWISFGTLLLGAGTIYKLGNLKDAFYVPCRSLWGFPTPRSVPPSAWLA